MFGLRKGVGPQVEHPRQPSYPGKPTTPAKPPADPKGKWSTCSVSARASTRVRSPVLRWTSDRSPSRSRSSLRRGSDAAQARHRQPACLPSEASAATTPAPTPERVMGKDERQRPFDPDPAPRRTEKANEDRRADIAKRPGQK